MKGKFKDQIIVRLLEIILNISVLFLLAIGNTILLIRINLLLSLYPST